MPLDTSIYGNIQTPQQMSLGDIVNLARGTQAYQQAQQVNPLAVQQAQQTLQNTQTTGQQLKQNLNVSQEDYARRLLGGVQNMPELKPNEKGEYNADAWKATTKMLRNSAEAANLPKHESNLLGQVEDAVKSDDYKTASKLLGFASKSAGTTSEQYAANLPQFNTNAAGTPFLTNRAEGTITAPMTAGGKNLTPTNVGVANFGDYQKDLTTRVASATQNEMRLNEAENLMKEFKPGAGARTYVDVAQKLQAVGAPQDLVDKVAKGDLSAAQSLNKFIAQTVIQAATATPGTAESINRYIRDNPDIGSDPRALERFFEFTRKQNSIPIEEQKFLLNKAQTGTLNPDTHVSEAQQHILKKFAQKENTITSKEQKNATYGKYKGRDVVSFDGGKSWEYK